MTRLTSTDTHTTTESARLGGGSLRDGARQAQQFIQPAQGRVTSPFGYRIHPILHTRRFHDGIDIAAGMGSRVVSTADGVVTAVKRHPTYGLMVVVRHVNGYESRYCHLSAANVQPGQHVLQKDQVGKVGSSGWSTGPHLHFTLLKDGVPVNPSNIGNYSAGRLSADDMSSFRSSSQSGSCPYKGALALYFWNAMNSTFAATDTAKTESSTGSDPFEYELPENLELMMEASDKASESNNGGSSAKTESSRKSREAVQAQKVAKPKKAKKL